MQCTKRYDKKYAIMKSKLIFPHQANYIFTSRSDGGQMGIKVSFRFHGIPKYACFVNNSLTVMN
jgi:hypothetical protein